MLASIFFFSQISFRSQNFFLLNENTINFSLQYFSSFFFHFSSFEMLIREVLFFLPLIFYSLCCSFFYLDFVDELLQEIFLFIKLFSQLLGPSV